MSGVEIVVAAAATASLVASGVSAYEQVKTANESTAIQNQQIREQQVQLRLQENQSSIERMRKLQQVLATEEVTLGARNISGSAGTAMAFTTHNFEEFYADENADKLNFAAKQLALGRQQQLIYQQRRAQVFGAIGGFVKEGASTVLSAAQVPSKSLVDATSNTGAAQKQISSAPSIEGTRSFQSQRNLFDLNA